MRLIDADDLKDQILILDLSLTNKRTILSLIDKSYSVPDKGIWLYPNANKVIGKRIIGRREKVCSRCGTCFTNNIPWDAKYCPECGIKIVTRLDICSDL